MEEEDLDELYASNSSAHMNAYRAFLGRFLASGPLAELNRFMETKARRAKAFKSVEVYVRQFVLPVRPAWPCPLRPAADRRLG